MTTTLVQYEIIQHKPANDCSKWKSGSCTQCGPRVHINVTSQQGQFKTVVICSPFSNSRNTDFGKNPKTGKRGPSHAALQKRPTGGYRPPNSVSHRSYAQPDNSCG